MRFKWLVLVGIVLMPAGTVLAQSEEPEISLRLRRNFGYQAGRKMQGSFSLEAVTLDRLVSVDFRIDGEMLATVSESPFLVTFSTSAYKPGEHQLQAFAINSAGESLESPVVGVTFITAEESWQGAGRIAGWILGGALLLMLVGTFGAGLLWRGRTHFEPGVYGSAGGAVCKRCQLPFSRHLFALNLLIGKLERCPHCGLVAIVPRASQGALEAAEMRYRADQVKGQRAVQTDEEDFRRRLEDSRFEG